MQREQGLLEGYHHAGTGVRQARHVYRVAPLEDLIGELESHLVCQGHLVRHDENKALKTPDRSLGSRACQRLGESEVERRSTAAIATTTASRRHTHRHCSFFPFFFICSATMFSGRKIGLSDGQNGNMSG